MTIWERLFGTPERTARTLYDADFSAVECCALLDTISVGSGAKCRNCPYECTRYGCEPKDMKVVDWLMSEVVE